MTTVNCALIQHRCRDSHANNLAASCTAIRRAAADGAELIVLAELHGSAYFCQSEDCANFALAETIDGTSVTTLSALAAELRIVLVISLFERRSSAVYHNSAVVVERDGSIAGVYRKMHIPDDPGFYEKFYFTPGDGTFTPIATSVGKLGVLVCWDQWYPEAARLMALAGAQLLIYPTAIGWDPADDSAEQQRQLDAWLTVQRGHAIANGVPLLAVNRFGFEAAPTAAAHDGIEFWGNSFVAGPQGEILARAAVEECVVHASVDLHRSEQVRRIWPFFRDRRIDAYAELTRRWRD